MNFSIIVPVFNRPEEVEELLESLTKQTYQSAFEVVIVEDGSTIDCADAIQKFDSKLNIKFFFKENSGPGDSRNFGMRNSKGDYFLIFDSDCIIPPEYLTEVEASLKTQYVDCFGGPDAALSSFSDIQLAINQVMTSFFTTGGVRGGDEKLGRFQPRSFNMGLSKNAFEATNGFGNIHPGEDPELVFRLWDAGFQTKLIKTAFVYHKRRISWEKFYQQVHKFGKVRPILNHWHPKYRKLSYFLPLVWVSFAFISILLLFLNISIPFFLLILYYLIVFLESAYKLNNVKIALYVLWALTIQFMAYSLGFVKTLTNVQILHKNPLKTNPELFFKKND
jgi:glycosyltransferase involved in cell wall biosynthesis